MGLLESLTRTESGGNWAAQNAVPGAGGLTGHFGRLQFGQARLQDAMRAGVIPQGTTPQQFMADPGMQQRVEQWHFNDIDQQARAMGLDRYLGQNIGGVNITQDAIRAMAHLGGIGGARQFLETGGRYNPSDAFGTSLLDYARTHGDAGGLLAGGGTDTLMGGQGADTMAPQDNSIWRNMPGLLGDPDRRARLQIALEGMTLNPNQAVIAQAMQGIDDRSGRARQSETAAWLASQPGGEQFAQALVAGIPAEQVFAAWMQSQQPVAGPEPIEINGQLVDPTTGAVIGDYRTPESATVDPTSAMQNYDFLLSQGVPQEEALQRAFSGGVNVTVGQGETAFATETGKSLAQEAATVVQNGAIAQRNLGTLGSLEAALANAPQGVEGALANVAGNLGIKTEGSSDLEVANALISQLVPQQRPPGSGQMSDRDVQLFKESLPRLINTPEGNAKILQTMRAVMEYDVARGQIARRLQLGEITVAEADQQYNALGNPLAEYATQQPSASTPAGGVRTLTFNPATGGFD